MAFSFPDFNIEVVKRDQKWGEQIVDAAIRENVTRAGRLAQLNNNYQSYNGNVDARSMQWLTKTYGKATRTKYKDYKLIRNKIKQLLGEFLDIGFRASVSSVNPNAINEKLNNAYFMLGAVHAKEQIERSKEVLNIDPTDGIKVPDKDDPSLFSIITPKSENEVVMQRIVNDKVKKGKIKQEFVNDFLNVVIGAECFGKIEGTKNGVDVYRSIDPRAALYQESYGDFMLKRSPYLGEIQTKYVYEIIRDSPMTDIEIKRLKGCETNSTEYSNLGIKQLNNQHAVDQFTIQWRSLTPIITKTSPTKPLMGLDDQTKVEDTAPYELEVTQEYYNSHIESIKNDIAKGTYKISVQYKEDIYEMSRVGKTIYTPLKKVQNQIQVLDGGNYYTAKFDYTGMLYSTIDGIRISIQELGNDIQTMHNIVMFQLNREVNKIKGSVVGYDRAYIPGGKTMRDVWFNLTEDGYLEFDSSEDGVDSDKRAGLNAVKQINIGTGEVIRLLLALKEDLENSADKITGITQDRSGDIAASATVTNAQANISASKSVTQDIFYLTNEYFEEVLSRLCNKTKQNRKWLETEGLTAIGTDAVAFIKANQNFAYDEYVCELNDGRKENALRERLRQLFPVELNSGQIRTKDIARFEIEENISEALAVLDRASSEITNIAKEQTNSKLAQENQQLKTQLQSLMSNQDSTFKQQKDMEVLKTEGKKDVLATQAKLKFGEKVYDNRQKSTEADQQREHDMALQNQQQQQQNTNQQ